MTGNTHFSILNQSVFDLVLCRTKGSISTELEDETVILDISSGIYSGLDPVGTFIWNQLEHPVSVAALRQEIIKKYNITEDQCTVDLLNFLQDLSDNGLICCDNQTIE
jgi:hypothetical protein